MVRFVGLFVCQQDYGKTTGPNLMKLGGRAQHKPRKKLLHFVNKFLLTLRDMVLTHVKTFVICAPPGFLLRRPWQHLCCCVFV